MYLIFAVTLNRESLLPAKLQYVFICVYVCSVCMQVWVCSVLRVYVECYVCVCSVLCMCIVCCVCTYVVLCV